MTDKLQAPNIRRRPRPGTASAIQQPGPAPSYEVGYGKPPTAHRFKPGQSGNPKGRPKGARGMNALARELLEKKVEIRADGRVRKVPRIQALLMKQLELAVRGDPRALAAMFQAYRQAVPDVVVPVDGPTDEIETAADLAILAAYRASILAEGDQ